MEHKRTVLIIDDHPIFREGLKSILGCSEILEVIGEASGAKDGLSIARKMNPDLVLTDISLPDENGIELTRKIRTALPDTRVIIISMHNKVDRIVDAFQAGATGYIIKESAAERLVDGIRDVLDGKYYLDSSVSHSVVKRLMESSPRDKMKTDTAYGALTSREQEVMALLAHGIPIKKIAERLFLSPKTVQNHRANIMSKLDIHNSHELIRYAARLGIIDVDVWRT